MMHILFIAPYGGLGGSENVLVNVLERLDRTRFDPEGPPARGRPAERPRPGARHPDAGPAPARQARRPAGSRPPRTAIPGPVDVIHANGGKAAIYGAGAAPAALKAPLIWMKHDHSYDGRLHARARRPLRPRRVRFARDGHAVRRSRRQGLRDLPRRDPARPEAGRDDAPHDRLRRPHGPVQGLRRAAPGRGAAARRGRRRSTSASPARRTACTPRRRSSSSSSPTSSASAARTWAGPTTSTRSTRWPVSSRSRASPRARTALRARARRSC